MVMVMVVAVMVVVVVAMAMEMEMAMVMVMLMVMRMVMLTMVKMMKTMKSRFPASALFCSDQARSIQTNILSLLTLLRLLYSCGES